MDCVKSISNFFFWDRLSDRASGVTSIEAEESKDVLKSLCAHRSPLTLMNPSRRVLTHASAFADGVLHLEPSSLQPFGDTPFLHARFELFNECYVLEGRASQGHDSFSITPSNLYKLGQRVLDRVSLPSPGKFSVHIQEMSGRRRFAATLADISSQGLGLRVQGDARDGVRRFLSADLHVLVEPRIESVDRETVPATVAHWRLEDDGTISIGLKCHIPIAVGDRNSLEDFLLDQKYPHVRRSKTNEDYSSVWDLMIHQLENVIHVDSARKTSSIITWKKTSWSQRPLHRIYILKDEGLAETTGTLSVSRFYSRSWLIHQLAVDASKGKIMSHELYGRVLDFLRQSDEASYTVGTWPKTARVFQRYYLDFIQNDAPDMHYLEDTWILEFDTQRALEEVQAKKRPLPLSIRPFQYSDQTEILSELRKRFPPIFMKALDLQEYDMKLRDIDVLYGRVGLERKREIYLAHMKNELVGFSIVEWGSKNQNIFSLFDNFRIITTAAAKPEDVFQIKLALLEKTLLHYEKLGIDQVITWSKDEDMKNGLQTCHLSLDAFFWIANARQMKKFLRHLDRFHGRMESIKLLRSRRETKSN